MYIFSLNLSSCDNINIPHISCFLFKNRRRLKMQEITGNDDGHVPFYLCFLRTISILRHPRQKTAMIPMHSLRSEDGDDSKSHHR